MRIQNFLAQSPVFAFYLATSGVVEAFQSRLKKYDVHLLQGLILTSLLFEERQVRPSELSGVLQVDRSTLSHALRGLEKQELLRRDLLASDARGYALSLTATGKRRAAQLVKEFDAVQEALEAGLGAKRVRSMVDDVVQCQSVYKNWANK